VIDHVSAASPDVTIVVVVHDDAENLVGCVESAINQSHQNIEIIIVDDCSEDDSLDVAQSLASRDPRVRVCQTESNSGGPGGPRNVGLDQARAEWVTFLDSDDSLDPHAVSVLFEATRAASTPDVVCGHTERLYVESGRVVGWHDKLYGSHRELGSIEEYIDLVVDTTATGKLYRQGFLAERGIHFLEGVHYEDLIFSAQVYSSAKCIVVIPERVYIWKVYPVDVRKSITNMRDDEINLVHRLEATRRVDDVVSAPGRELLKKRYQQKFLEHDARLYLKDMGGVPDRQAERVLETLEPRLRAIPRDVFARLSTVNRLLYGAALSHSVEGVRELGPSLVGRWTLEGRTVRSAGSVRWRPTAPLPSDPEIGSLEHWLLDISDDAILSMPLSSVVYGHRATSIAAQGPNVAQVSGFTVDPLELVVPEIDRSTSRLVFSLRDSEYEFSCPVVLSAAAPQRLEWRSRVRIPRGIPLVRPMQFDLSLEIQRGDQCTRSVIWLDGEIDTVRIKPSSVSLRALMQQWFTFRRTRAGRLALRLSDPHGRRGRFDEFVHGVAGYSGRPTPE